MYSAGDKLPAFTGDKLPESTGEDDSTFLGKLFRLYWGMVPLDVCIPSGNNLIFRLPGMLAEECLYSVGECLDLLGIPTSLRLSVD